MISAYNEKTIAFTALKKYDRIMKIKMYKHKTFLQPHGGSDSALWEGRTPDPWFTRPVLCHWANKARYFEFYEN